MFLLAMVLVGGGTVVGLSVIPLAGAFVGMLAGSFILGLAVESRPVIETGIAAGIAKLGVLASGGLISGGLADGAAAVAAIPLMTLVGSLALSIAVGAFGAHFGDDLRDGLTTPVEESSSGDQRPLSYDSTRSVLNTANEETTVDTTAQSQSNSETTTDDQSGEKELSME